MSSQVKKINFKFKQKLITKTLCNLSEREQIFEENFVFS